MINVKSRLHGEGVSGGKAPEERLACPEPGKHPQCLATILALRVPLPFKFCIMNNSP
ncbi:hypothetical protein SCFA_1160002 [anaerobic digester metagenome]|uniref:Uncharacterized protein n=1 Tax=anaerobic digester metagenome TaxID=1263854 RepID=A0A485LVI2_9ZZZZ